MRPDSEMPIPTGVALTAIRRPFHLPGTLLTERAYAKPKTLDYFDEPDSENFVVHIAGFLTAFMNLRLVRTYPHGGGHVDAVYLDLDTSERLRVEWQLYSTNFVAHGHDPAVCDMVFCWQDNLSGSDRNRLLAANPDLSVVEFRKLLHHYDFKRT